MYDSEKCSFCGGELLDVTNISGSVKQLKCPNQQCSGRDRLAMAREFGSLLLLALGVNPRDVGGFTLDVNAGEAIGLTVRRVVTRGQAGALVQVIEQNVLRWQAPVATESGADPASTADPSPQQLHESGPSN